jgi:hypothetical protein
MIITSDTINKHKDINHLKELPHLMVKLEDLKNTGTLPLSFENGKWLEVGSPETEV